MNTNPETRLKEEYICVLTPPIGVHSTIPLSHLIEILLKNSSYIFLITGNEGYNYFKNDPRLFVEGINHEGKSNNVLRIINYLILQIKISLAIIRVIKKCNTYIFFLGSENLIFPMMVVKIFRKSVFLMFAGSSIKTLYYDNLVSWLKVLSFINCLLADKIILYSKYLIEEWNLKRYATKIIIAHEHYIDFSHYNITIPFIERNSIIGYIGRLSEEKGICSFIQTIPSLLTKKKCILVIICGEGKMRESIESYLTKHEISQYVQLTGWIHHDILPEYLNQLKLLVLPSSTEGLPNIILEAMACGTPVLATSVGAIPDVIQDCKNGFLLENTTPACITKNVLRVLNYPDLEQITKNGRMLIEEEFSFEKTVERWNNILGNIK